MMEQKIKNTSIPKNTKHSRWIQHGNKHRVTIQWMLNLKRWIRIKLSCG